MVLGNRTITLQFNLRQIVSNSIFHNKENRLIAVIDSRRKAKNQFGR